MPIVLKPHHCRIGVHAGGIERGSHPTSTAITISSPLAKARNAAAVIKLERSEGKALGQVAAPEQEAQLGRWDLAWAQPDPLCPQSPPPFFFHQVGARYMRPQRKPAGG